MNFFKDSEFIFIHFGETDLEIIESRFKNICNDSVFLTKPRGGFWGCEYLPNSEYKSEWGDFATHGLSCGCSSSYLYFKVLEDANILLIEDIMQVMELSQKYPITNDFTESLRDFEEEQDKRYKKMMELIQNEDQLEFYKDLLLSQRKFPVDFEKIEQDGYDGVFVKDFSGLYNAMYGWDMPSIVLFNLNHVEQIPTEEIENAN